MTARLRALIALVLLFLPLPAHGLRVVSKDAGVNLNTRKVVKLYGEINLKMAEKFEIDVIKVMGYPGPLVILIDSPGGYSDGGLKIIKVIATEQAKGVQVIGIVVKYAQSMAFNILTLCDIRLATPKAVFMFHYLARSHSIDPKDGRITPQLLRKEAHELEVDDYPFRRANREALHMSAKDYDGYARHDHEWRAAPLFEIGYLHGIIKHRK